MLERFWKNYMWFLHLTLGIRKFKPLIGFKNNKSLKAHLVRSQLPELDEVGKSKSRREKRPPCHLCENIRDTCTFKSKHLDEIHKINKNYNCNSKMAVSLSDCKYVVNNILGVQKQSLGLGQITTKVRSESFWIKRQFQSKPWNKNVFMNITVQIDIMA